MKKMSEKFKDEREAVCDKIINILELTNGEFILSELDENIEKQQRLLELKTEISKFFECSTISTFKPNFECKRPYLNLVRGILRKQRYKFEANDYLVKLDNGFLKRTTKYKIFRDK
jgi:predicted rRNA methylase YqxC with S4 and FtsJ domains